MDLPLTHFVVSTEFVRSPIVSASPAMEGITESSSVNSFCSFAFLAASATAATRAASAATRAASAAISAGERSISIVETETLSVKPE